jgi:hypothetical protein
MARAHCYHLLVDAAGDALPGSQVAVCYAGTTTPISATIWADDSSATVLGNPFTAVTGAIEFYLDEPQRVCLQVTPQSSSPQTFDNVDVGPDMNLPSGYVGPSALALAPSTAVTVASMVQYTLGNSVSGTPLFIATINAVASVGALSASSDVQIGTLSQIPTYSVVQWTTDGNLNGPGYIDSTGIVHIIVGATPIPINANIYVMATSV